MDTTNAWLTPIAACVAGLLSKIVWDWLNRNNTNNKDGPTAPSPIVGDWGTVTYLKSHLPQMVERMDKMNTELRRIEEKVIKIDEDNSATDDKTGRKLVYVPQSVIEDMSDLKAHSIESASTLKQILEMLTRFFQVNSDALSKQNEALTKQNQILTELKLNIK